MSPQPKPTILDGGMSRELMTLNAPFRQPEWSALSLIEAPHLVQEAHGRFIVAGADVITTNSYALVPYHIGEERWQRQGEELIKLAGKVARDAVNQNREEKENEKKVLVAGCLPPIFGSYEPQNFDETTVQNYLGVFVKALEPYVDLWLGETLSLIAEAEAVVTALKKAASQKPLWVSFTLLDDERNESTRSDISPRLLRSGESVTSATEWVLSSGAEALLFNCSRPEVMAAAVVDAKRVIDQHNDNNKQTGKPRIGVYANAFVPMREEHSANVGISALREELQDTNVYTGFAREWNEKGAEILGGCCGIGSGHIESLARAFK